MNDLSKIAQEAMRVVIVTGLAILETEFAWARRLLRKTKENIRETARG